MVRRSVAIDKEFVLCVDGVVAIIDRHLEEVGHRDRLRGACFNTHGAEDASQEVDLVDEAVPLTLADRGVCRVVRTTDVDAVRRAHTCAEFTPDAFLLAVVITVQDMSAVETLRLDPFLVRILDGDARLAHLAHGDRKPTEGAEDVSEPTHCALLMTMATRNLECQPQWRPA